MKNKINSFNFDILDKNIKKIKPINNRLSIVLMIELKFKILNTKVDFQHELFYSLNKLLKKKI